MLDWLNDQRRRWLLLATVIVIAGGIGLTASLRHHPLRQPAPAPPATPQLDPDLARRYAREPVISLYVHETGQRLMIPVEQYLPGVAAAEGTPNMPPEALKALIIAARTMTLQNRDDPTAASHVIDGADACTSPTHFQAYAPEKVTDAIRQAVAATRGQVLTYGGSLIYAAFSSYSGGRTATALEAFGPAVKDEPYLQSVDSPQTVLAPAAEQNWTLTVKKNDLLAEVGATASGPVSITQHGPSGRALEVRVGNRTITGIQLRSILGSMQMRSTLITGVQDQGGSVVFTGRGWGHGAGLDQWGADALARQGWSEQRILGHYYQRAAVQQLYH